MAKTTGGGGDKGGGTVGLIKRRVVTQGITAIAFDRYAGDNKTQLEPHQKMYFGEDLETICLPSENIQSFLSSINTKSAPTRAGLGKGWKQVAQDCLSFVSIEPALIPFSRDGKPIKFGKFEPVNSSVGNAIAKDERSGTVVRRHVARLKDGLPNPKVRPFLPAPWQLEFTLSIYPNESLQEAMIQKLFKVGGITIGFGTYRGVFGKFEVVRWE